MDDSDSPQNLYAKNLQQLFGYPLRFPEPKPGLPPSYAEDGLHIGDVGYIDEEGMFEVLFNICLSPDHELHRDQDKDLTGLVGLTAFKPKKVPPVPNALSSGRVICHGIQGPHGDRLSDIQSGPCQFVSSSTSGAILILPSGAARRSLTIDKQEEFRKLAERHARDWCQLAGCSSIYLITGFYKTNAWYLASFQGVRPLKQVLLERDDAGRFTWHSKCDYRQSLRGNHSENQTVLILGFKIQVREWGKHVLIEKLPLPRRSIWSEFTTLMGFLFYMFTCFWEWMILRGGIFELQGQDVSVHINRMPALFPPFHPSDIINRYLLEKDPSASVAITHDSQWLSMLEQNQLPHEVIMDERRFCKFLEDECKDVHKSDDVVYLQRKIDKPNSEGCNYDLYKPAASLKEFAFPTTDGIQQTMITHMRVEKIVAHLGRMPISFHVLVQFDGTKRRSKPQTNSVYHDIVEWDDEIVLPIDPTTRVQFSVHASFEFEPILGNGQMLYMVEVSVGHLVQRGSSCIPLLSGTRKDNSSFPSLLVTLEERNLDPFVEWIRNNCNMESEDRSYTRVAEATDNGHRSLLRYHNGEGIAELEKCLESFKLALALCHPDHKCHAAVLCNYATASFTNCQARNTASDLDAAITLYRKALGLRPDGHPDRPGTLLYLAQALLYYQGRLRWEASVADEIQALVAEIKQTCSTCSHYHRAADLVEQTLKMHRVLTFGKLVDLEELVWDLDQSAKIPPGWYFDRLYRLINLSTTLRKCFKLTSHLHYIEKSISMIKEAFKLQSASGNHLNKSWLLACLGDALCMHSVHCGGFTDLDASISTFESAIKLIPDGCLDRPWMLASLGDALLVRFVQRSDLADLESSISMIENALQLAPDGHFDRPWILASLSHALCVQTTQCDGITRLNDLIFSVKNTIELAPDGHFMEPWMLASLAGILCLPFVHHGDVIDLDKSVSMISDALTSIPDVHSGNRPWMLAALAEALHIRFLYRGDATDLDNSISMIKDALKSVPDNHFNDRPRMLTILGDTLRIRFVHCGDIADLDSSISTIKDAVDSIPDCHFDKPRMLAVLGDALRIRFVQCGDVTSLKNSISMMEDAVKLVPDSRFYKPWTIASLGHTLCVHSVQCHDIVNLERSISLIKNAMELVSPGHSNRPQMLATLGDAFRVRFAEHSNAADLDSSITAIKDALEVIPDSHSDRPWMLASFGNVLRARFIERGDVDDLETSISILKDAAGRVPDGHFDRPWIVASLGDAFRARSMQRGDDSDRENSVSMFQDAMKGMPDGHSDKLWILVSLNDAHSMEMGKRIVHVKPTWTVTLNVLFLGKLNLGGHQVINFIAGPIEKLNRAYPAGGWESDQHLRSLILGNRIFKLHVVPESRSISTTVSVQGAQTRSTLANLRENGGVHLLVYCINASGSTSWVRETHRSIASYSAHVPVVAIVGGVTNAEERGGWRSRNEDTLSKEGPHFNDYAFIGTGVKTSTESHVAASRHHLHRLILKNYAPDSEMYSGFQRSIPFKQLPY